MYFPDLRHNRYVEQRMVSRPFHSAMHQDSRVLKGDGVPTLSPLIRPFLRVIHLIEPIRRRGELAPIEDHPQGEVGVVEVEVEGHAPHDDQTRVQVLDLPADCAAGARGCTTL